MASKAIVAIVAIFAVALLAPSALAKSVRQAEVSPAPEPSNSNTTTGDDAAVLALSIYINIEVDTQQLADAIAQVKGNLNLLKNITKEFVGNVTENVGNEVEQLVQYLDTLRAAVQNETNNIGAELKEKLTKALDTIKADVQEKKAQIQDAINKVKKDIEDLKAIQKEVFKNVTKFLNETLQKIAEKADTFILGFGKKTKDAVVKLQDKLKNATSTLVDVITDLQTQSKDGVIDLVDLLQALAQKDIQEAKDLLNKLNTQLLSFGNYLHNTTALNATATKLASKIATALNTTEKAVLGLVTQLGQDLSLSVNNIAAAVATLLGGVGDLVLGLGGVLDKVIGGLVGTVGGVVGGLFGGLNGLLGGLAGGVFIG